MVMVFSTDLELEMCYTARPLNHYASKSCFEPPGYCSAEARCTTEPAKLFQQASRIDSIDGARHIAAAQRHPAPRS
eukprot:771531-Pyramimonas_sp.AAC.1